MNRNRILPGINALLIARLTAGLLACVIGISQALAASVTHAQVRVVTGAAELTAGSVLELRIYQAGKAVVRVALAHGEPWPRDSTRVIPVTLPAPIDPRTVLRFGLYYRASSPMSAPWEVVAADVDLSPGPTPELLLNTSLSGVISRQGELASEERAQGSLTCVTDSDCDDHRRCNGRERCLPGGAGADARGCVKGSPVACPVNQVCTEDRGCRGLDAARAPPSGAPSEPEAAAPAASAAPVP